MSDPHSPNFDPGGIKDRVDNRDYLYSEVGFATPPFDWNTGFDIESKLGFKVPVKDQGESGSCGGQAWSYYAGILEAIQTGTFEERSAKYVYSQTYVPGGGSRGRDNANIFVNQGVAREAVLSSYQNGNAPTEAYMERSGDITQAMRMGAKLDQSYSYSQIADEVNHVNIDKIAQAMRDNSGVILGLDGSNNGTWNSPFPLPPSSTEWRHWVYVGKAKLINGKKYVGLLNSWGSSVGEQGWQWIGEDYFTTGHVWSGWTHTFNATSVPPTFHYTWNTNLSFGQSGDDITALQSALQLDGAFPKTLAPSGFYGNVTASAVLLYRQKKALSSVTDPLGHSVGPLTRATLNKEFSG